MMRRLLPYIALGALTVSVACNRVPSDVIQPDEMAELMADVRVADAVINVNRADWANRASREALKAAIFERHGVTQAQFDSSLVWYGHNIGVYQDVTDRTIEILDKRLHEVGAQAAQAAMSVSGDSVDVWSGPVVYAFGEHTPSEFVTFGFEADQNMNPGDVYIWRARIVLPPREAEWSMTAEYEDGAVEVVQGSLSTAVPGRQELSFFSDSMRTVRYMSGWLRVRPLDNRPAVVDSVSLMRHRKFIPIGGRRLQRKIEPKRDESQDTTIRRD